MQNLLFYSRSFNKILIYMAISLNPVIFYDKYFNILLSHSKYTIKTGYKEVIF